MLNSWGIPTIKENLILKFAHALHKMCLYKKSKSENLMVIQISSNKPENLYGIFFKFLNQTKIKSSNFLI